MGSEMCIRDRLFIMVWNKRNAQRRHLRHSNNLLGDQCRRTVSTRDCKPSSRSNRRQPDHRNHPTGLHYYFLVGLLAVSPAYANEEPKVQNTSNPVAAATGNVTNQAVQFQNNGAPSRQYFGPNNSCNAATCLLYTSPSPRDLSTSRMPSSA